MNETTTAVRNLWVPEQPHNPALKLECLKIAATKHKDVTLVMESAARMYVWLTNGAKK